MKIKFEIDRSELDKAEQAFFDVCKKYRAKLITTEKGDAFLTQNPANQKEFEEAFSKLQLERAKFAYELNHKIINFVY